MEDKYVEAWQALVDAQKTGLIRSIGLSNFLPEHINRLEKETGVLPVINQVELHPYFNQAEQRTYHEEKNIITQSWSPLGRQNASAEEEVIQRLAEKYGKTPAQIILRWNIELGLLPIPKSAHASRQAENIAIFDFSLTKEEVDQMNKLTRTNGRNKDQDPRKYQEF